MRRASVARSDSDGGAVQVGHEHGGRWLAGLAIIVAFQFAYWFNPSEPFNVDIIVDAHNNAVSKHKVLNDVYPVSSYAMLPAAILVGAIYELVSPFSALLIGAVSTVFSQALVAAWVQGYIASPALWPLWLSEIAFALSFSAVFVVTAVLFTAVPTRYLQAAASLNRSVTLASTVSSALLGQVIAQGPNSRLTTLYLSVLAGGLSLTLLVVSYVVYASRCACSRLKHDNSQDAKVARAVIASLTAPSGRCFFRKPRPRRPDSLVVLPSPPAGQPACEGDVRTRAPNSDRSVAASQPEATHAGPTLPRQNSPTSHQSRGILSASPLIRPCLPNKRVAPSNAASAAPAPAAAATATSTAPRSRLSWLAVYTPEVLFWSVWSVVVLSVHTLVITDWQMLLEHFGSGPNGSVFAAAYLSSTVLTWAPSLLESIFERHKKLLLGSGTIVATALAIALRFSSSYAVAAVSFVAYHAVAETLLVLCNGQIGKAVAANELLPGEPVGAEGKLLPFSPQGPLLRVDGASQNATGVRDRAGAALALSEQSVAAPSESPVPTATKLSVGVTKSVSRPSGSKTHAPGNSCSPASSDPVAGSPRPSRHVHVPLSLPLPLPVPPQQSRRRPPRFAAVLCVNSIGSLALGIVIQAAVGPSGFDLGVLGVFSVFCGVLVALCIFGTVCLCIFDLDASRPKGSPAGPGSVNVSGEDFTADSHGIAHGKSAYGSNDTSNTSWLLSDFQSADEAC